MAIILLRSVAPRMQNYRRMHRRGFGDCSAADPSGCAGPYSSPMANFAYQNQLQQSGQSAPPPDYSPPVQPVNKVCQPWDSSCVASNVTQQVGYQVAIGQAQAQSNYDRCIANNTDPDTCRARWPVGYSGEVPILNLTPAQAAGAMATPAQAAAATQAIFDKQAADLKLIKKQTVPAGGGTSASLPVVTPDLVAANNAPGPSTGFSVAAVPWWGWLALGGAVLYAAR